MSRSAPLSEQEQADLVAFLDGELTGEAARAVERKITLDDRWRAEADSLKKTYDLLDFLPKPKPPSRDFTEQTLSRIEPDRAKAASATGGWWRDLEPLHRRILLGGVWAAAAVVAFAVGRIGYLRLNPPRPGEPELVRDLRIIENKRVYDHVDDAELLRALDHPDLFGEEGSGT